MPPSMPPGESSYKKIPTAIGTPVPTCLKHSAQLNRTMISMTENYSQSWGHWMLTSLPPQLPYHGSGLHWPQEFNLFPTTSQSESMIGKMVTRPVWIRSHLQAYSWQGPLCPWCLVSSSRSHTCLWHRQWGSHPPSWHTLHQPYWLLPHQQTLLFFCFRPNGPWCPLCSPWQSSGCLPLAPLRLALQRRCCTCSAHHGILFPFSLCTTLCRFSPNCLCHAVQARLCHKCCRHVISLGSYRLFMTSYPLP